MSSLLVGNAPCSWGTLEFEDTKGGGQVPYRQMLDELAATGYTGTELGDWGYMPTDPAALKAELTRRDLAMLGAFVPVALKDAEAHQDGIGVAVRTAKLLAAVAGPVAPYLVLADANGTVPARVSRAGRVTAADGLSDAEWKTFASGANALAKAVRDETGLRTVFHHHCAGFVETPDEIVRLMEMTDPDLLGLLFDAGHFQFGAGGDASLMMPFLERFAQRTWYFHSKDFSPEIGRLVIRENWDYFAALGKGIFCELGKGNVDFPSLLRWLRDRKYEGYVVVEQDVLPGLGDPKQSAQRNRDYLRSIESTLAL